MSAPGQEPQAPVTLPNGVIQENPAIVTNALLIALRRAAEDSAAAQDPREVAELGKAALSFAQAVVVLDPSLSQGGTPLAHDLELEERRQIGALAQEQERSRAAVEVERARGDNALRQAQEAAAAPSPAKTRSVSVRRDARGRADGYEVTEAGG